MALTWVGNPLGFRCTHAPLTCAPRRNTQKLWMNISPKKFLHVGWRVRLIPLQSSHLHISPFGVIPKKHQLGKWRLILDLSSPHGHSVNDRIPKDPYSLKYVTVDDAICSLVDLGPGALMAKFDVKAAYRNIPIHPGDRFLLGMKWRDKFYVDLVLPFRLRSAPFIFDSVAEAVEWILTHNYAIKPLFHYLDDFLTMGPPNSPICQSYVDTAFAVFPRHGLPLHVEKCEGPASTLVFLGIELDSVQQMARLPPDKVDRILRLLQSWSRKSTCTRRELESLIGSLHHTCHVVVPGRTFLRCMIDLLCCFRNRDHPICLNTEFCRDLQWWLSFFREWYGVSFFLSPSVSPLPDLIVSSDASGSHGFGALWRHEWFCSSWFFLSSPAWKRYPLLWQRISGARHGLVCAFSFPAIIWLLSIF